MVYVWAIVLFIANLLAWGTTMLSLPGNWLLLIFSVVYAVMLPDDAFPRLSKTILTVAFLLAVLGEVWEFFASAAGAAKQGGSRRGAVMAILGSIGGSIAGGVIGLPIPLFGPVIGAVGGGAAGAFVGAYIGELKRQHSDRVAIGKGAMWGRLFGTIGKLVVGLIMLSLITIDSFTDL